MSEGITLGQRIRGLRLGFCWSWQHFAFIRLSLTDAENVFRCEVQPAGRVEKGYRETYLKWWPSQHDKATLDINDIAGIKNLKRCKRPFVFYFNEQGETL